MEAVGLTKTASSCCGQECRVEGVRDKDIRLRADGLERDLEDEVERRMK